MNTPPLIVRLNSRTMPMSDIAREILAPLSPNLVEIEGAMIMGETLLENGV